jgi:hypothetical protein
MATEERVEQFAVEVDGDIHSVHRYFADAVRAGLTVQNAAPGAKIQILNLERTSQQAAA